MHNFKFRWLTGRKRKLLSILSLLTWILSINLLSIQAQSPEWEAWMYSNQNGRIIRIGSNSVIYNDLTLPGLQDHSYPRQITVSPDGQIIAYALTNHETRTQWIYVYNTALGSLISTYNIPSQQGQIVDSSIKILPTSQTFSPDSHQIAIGYTIGERWSLIVMDIADNPGTILLQVNSTDVGMVGVERWGFDVPTVVSFDGTIIEFVLIPTATGIASDYPHYSYDISSNTLTRNYYLTVPGGDFSKATGQFVFPLADYRLPNSSATYNSYGQQINSLHIWMPATTETYPIFNAPGRTLSRPVFIQNSEKILFQTYDWVSDTRELTILEPDNSIPTPLASLSSITLTGYEGTVNGFLVSVRTNDIATSFPELQSFPDRVVLLSFDTRVSSNGAPVEQVWFSEANTNYKLSWVQDNQLPERSLPPTWMPIASTVDASNYDNVTRIGSLEIGGQARIFTTEGDRVNVRSGAGTNFAIIQQLVNGAIVTVLEGPQTNSNFTWWFVQTETDIGWVVESVDGVRTLQPCRQSDC